MLRLRLGLSVEVRRLLGELGTGESLEQLETSLDPSYEHLVEIWIGFLDSHGCPAFNPSITYRLISLLS